MVFVFRVEFTVFASGKQFQLVEATRSCSATRNLGKDLYWWSHLDSAALSIVLWLGWYSRGQQESLVFAFFLSLWRSLLPREVLFLSLPPPPRSSLFLLTILIIRFL